MKPDNAPELLKPARHRRRPDRRRRPRGSRVEDRLPLAGHAQPIVCKTLHKLFLGVLHRHRTSQTLMT
jgi:hypothetical protein